MANCDLCNRVVSTGEYTIININDMKRAVLKGLVPPANSVPYTMGRVFGYEFDNNAWKARVMRDTTDWALCRNCMDDYRRKL